MLMCIKFFPLRFEFFVIPAVPSTTTQQYIHGMMDMLWDSSIDTVEMTPRISFMTSSKGEPRVRRHFRTALMCWWASPNDDLSMSENDFL
jgi:hypothetical protein